MSAKNKIIMKYVGDFGTIHEFRKDSHIYKQGDEADLVYYIIDGRIKLTVVSAQGKEAVVGIAESGQFIGENCLFGRKSRLSSAVSLTPSELVRFEKAKLRKILKQDTAFLEVFLRHLVARSTRLEEDVVDHILNTSERRLARILLLLAQYGTDHPPRPISPKISHELLAEMVGTTRSRITQFMNKFRQLGFINYNGSIEVNQSLLTYLLVNTEDPKE